MKTALAPLLLAAVLIPSSVFAAPAPTAEQTQRIAAAYVLALGRAPSAAELAQIAEAGPLPVSDLVARLRARIAGDPALARAVADRARRDALGEPLPADAAGRSPQQAVTYLELMQLRLAGLAAHPAEYEQVVRRAYRFLLRRDPYPSEVNYWKRRPVHSYVLLVACLENWARRNQPGLMETSGEATVSVNSEFLATVWLSPAIAAEARAAVGLPAAAAGDNLVAAGAAGIVSSGGIHFTAAGR